ncbi:MAG: LysR family transcriptional regulator [Lautropia sp.]
MLPDIDSLALFVRAAELHSLTKAAEASHIGLAAASRRIALLEHRFQAPLFDRSPRGVELTPAGSTLFVHARALLLRMNQLQSDMSDYAAGRRGILRILANTSAMTEFLPEDLASFTEANPDIRLIIEERWSAEIVNAVLASEADLGIVMEGYASDDLVTTPYRSDLIAVVTRTDHPLAQRQAPRFAEVLEHDVIALEGSSSMMRLLATQATIAGRALRLRVQVRSFEAVCRMVQARLGIGLLPLQAARALAQGLDLSVQPLAEDWAERRMLICARRKRPPAAALDALIAHLGAFSGPADPRADRSPAPDGTPRPPTR